MRLLTLVITVVAGALEQQQLDVRSTLAPTVIGKQWA